MRSLVLLPILFSTVVGADTGPGCEMSTALRTAWHNRFGWSVRTTLPSEERKAYERRTLREFVKSYPREFEPWKEIHASAREARETADYDALVAERREQVQQHPEDPFATLLLADLLRGRKTPEALQLFESIQDTPGYELVHLELANLYSGGRTKDQSKAEQQLRRYFAQCPASLSGLRVLDRTAPADLQARVLPAIRARLQKETEPAALEEFRNLWSLEFRTRTPAEHAALRKQVAADLARMESLHPKVDSLWAQFLLQGHRQAGESKEQIARREESLLRDFPGSEEALRIESNRYREAHPEPEDHKDVAAWDRWRKAKMAVLADWRLRYPKALHLYRSNFIAESGLSTLTEARGVELSNEYVWASRRQMGEGAYNFIDPVEMLLERRWAPKLAFEWARKAADFYDRDEAVEQRNDNVAADDPYLKYAESGWREMLSRLLRAALAANDVTGLARYRLQIEGPAPKDPNHLSTYWQTRARLAAVEGRKVDARTYYRKALETRTETPHWTEGWWRDPLAEDARATFRQLGGTEAAWAVWASNPVEGGKKEIAEGAWEKPKKRMPEFELSDLKGTIWRWKSLEGKAVLINVWATWCGPCQAEMPKLEKLYQSLKSDANYQILSFNVDDDLGLVEPFIHAKGYTFPVLPAEKLVRELLDGDVSIPRNWLLDAKGTWKLEQIGYDSSEPDWPAMMRGKLDSLRKAR